MLIGEFEDAITVLEKAVKFHKRAELYYQLSNSFLNWRRRTRTKCLENGFRIRLFSV
jgi:hypothetical protein